MRNLSLLALIFCGCSTSGVGLNISTPDAVAAAPPDTREADAWIPPTAPDAFVADVEPAPIAPDAYPDALAAAADSLTSLADTQPPMGQEVSPEALQASPDTAPAVPVACPYAVVRGTFCMGYWQGNKSVPHTWCVQACQDSVSGIHVGDTIGKDALCMASARENSGDPTTHTGSVACIPAGTCDIYCPE